MQTEMKMAMDGKPLPDYLRLFRDDESGVLEFRFWKFQPILLFVIPFMCVWSGGSIFGCYVLPFLKAADEIEYLLPCLFGIPFLVASVIIWGGILAALFGTKKLILERGRGCYSYKLLGIGYSRSFDLRHDTEVTSGSLSFINVFQGTGRPGSRLRVKNGYRSFTICAGWSEDAIEFIGRQLASNRA